MSAPRELVVVPDADAVARRAARTIARAARTADAESGAFALAMSASPRAMLARLAAEELPWEHVGVWQVDERVAPEGHADRNLTGLLAGLPEEARPAVRPMPVEDPDLEAAAGRYAAGLPPAFDLIHLGLGEDGHTASLVPGDPMVDTADRDVAVTGEYRGRRRMTLTLPVIDRARLTVWVVTGSVKADALRRLLASDPSIPAARVRTAKQVVLADAAAASAV